MKDALITLSNPISQKDIDTLIQLYPLDLTCFSNDVSLRAKIFNEWLKADIDRIFDVSGGDYCNLVLDHIDYAAYKSSCAVYHGYSDCTTLVNALYSQTQKEACLYPLKHNPYGKDVRDDVDWKILKGNIEPAILVGGNVRCLLKLAATKYFPDMEDKVLFLESRSGDVYRISSYFAQLKQMGIFSKIKGLALGQFLEISEKELFSVAKMYDGAIVYTDQVGHRHDSKALYIGRKYSF